LHDTMNNGWGMSVCVLNHGTKLSAGDFPFFFSLKSENFV